MCLKGTETQKNKRADYEQKYLEKEQYHIRINNGENAHQQNAAPQACPANEQVKEGRFKNRPPGKSLFIKSAELTRIE